MYYHIFVLRQSNNEDDHDPMFFREVNNKLLLTPNRSRTMACALPDACENDSREESLLAIQQRDDGRSWIVRMLHRDRNLAGACAFMLVLMNIDTGRYVLYPFLLFATWVHEMSHGTAAILVGGRIQKLEIYHDGGGICWNDLDGITWKKAVVASAGYTGTAFWGCILLLFRRTVLGPTIGTITLGVAIVLTCVLFVRNTFGFVVLFIEGLTLILCGWLLPAVWLDNLFAFLAANCSMNALLDIRNLYGSAQNYNGDTLMNTDAQAVAEYWGGDYRLWATFWLVFAVVATLIGLMFARDARALPTSKTDLAGGQSVHDQEGKPPTGDVSSAKLNAERHYWAQPL